MRELLPIVDNLERALQSAAHGEGHLAEGVRLVHSELVAVLERNGVQQFDPAGERFDPAEHEALSVRDEHGVRVRAWSSTWSRRATARTARSCVRRGWWCPPRCRP